MRSELCLCDLSGHVEVVLTQAGRIEAPNWLPNGELLVNSAGALYRVPLAAPRLIPFDTGLTRLNNDHGPSPDGRLLAFSTHHHGQGAELWVMPLAGGAARRLVDRAPAWFHGWSPDSRTVVYVAARRGRVVDVCTQDLDGAEVVLTGGEGHCDGPEFSADGRRIFYNCDREGHAQIWGMARDGSDQRRLFADDHVNWFPHPSPDGRHLVYLRYPPGTEGHPADLPVSLVLCDPEGGDRRVLASFTGGQGTINVNSWEPGGRRFAFVRYGA